MCGICGIYIPSGCDKSVDRTIIERMTSSMVHRGPDSEGFYLSEKIGFGSRRLSIIDVDGGDQPISNEDQSCWIVLNGEIYNYKALHEYLLRRGHQFRTHSDTETILHLYEEYGIKCVDHLDGIFSFAIWNSNQQEFILARDRLGIKPIYYSILPDGQFIFGSEMRTILAHPAIDRDIDPISLNEYLSYEYVPTPRTILRNIYRLEAGSILQFNCKGFHNIPYDHLSFRQGESRPPMDWREYADGLYNVIRSSVSRELTSDVPVGVLLSGGIDSSTIAALMTDLYPGKIQSFTIGFEENSFDESKYARIVAKHLGTQHNEMVLTSKNVIDLVHELPEILDEPFADSSFIPTYYLSKLAHKKVKVVLGGDGGDELLAGYPTLIAHQLIEYYERFVPWSMRAYLIPRILALLNVSFDNISLDFKLQRFLSGRGVPLLVRHQRWLGSFTDDEKGLLLQDWLKPILRDTYFASFTHARECDAQQALNKILYNDQRTYLEGDILFKVDRASMANSLEVRVPFLNREVVKYANDLPLDLKFRNLTGKFILKKALRNHLPREIIQRPKKGFNMPVAYWLEKDLKGLMKDLLSEQYIHRQELFNYSFINQLIEDHLAHRKDNRKMIWTLMMFQLWYQGYIE